MHEIGHLLGLGHTYDLPGAAIMGVPGTCDDHREPRGESLFPGPSDIVHMQLLYRPDSKDIDVYSFTRRRPDRFL